MSTEREKYLRLKADLEELGPKVNALEKSVQQLQADAGPAEHAALKAEISMAAGAKEQKKAVTQILDRILLTSAEVEGGKKRIRAMSECLGEFRERARVEVLAECNKALAPAVKAFAGKLREAAAAEITFDGIQKDLRKAFTEIDAPVPAQLEPVSPILMRDRSYKDTKRPWEEFLEKMRALELSE